MGRVQRRLERRVAAACRRLGLEGRSALVAVSGGLDSTALLHLLHAISQDLRLKLFVGHVNHGLRGAQADADEGFVRELGEQLGCPVLVQRVDPLALRAGRPSRERPSLQEAARRARYRALAALARRAGGARIVTAHTLDDQAETVLLRLLRGCGPAGLAGIPERSPTGEVVRPLLDVSRTELEAYARGRGLCWREDPSNRDLRFARSRLRQRWLPALAAEFNPRLLRALARLAEAQRRELEWTEAVVEREAARCLRQIAPGRLSIEASGWDAMPEALARRLARKVMERLGRGRDVSHTHLLRMVHFLRSGRTGTEIELPGGVKLRRLRREFVAERANLPECPPC